MKKKVSIITATYNLAKKSNFSAFYEMFRSIHEQDYTNIEHVIVDGDSDASSKEYIKKVIGKYQKKEVLFISEPDRGIFDATNKGFKRSSGDYITLMCDDDFYTRRNSVRILVNLLEVNNADFSFGDSWWLDIKKWGADPWSFAYRHPFLVNCLLLKRDVIERLGYYFNPDYKICSGLQLFFDLLTNPDLKYAYTNKILTVLRPGGISNGQSDNALIQKESIDIYRKYLKEKFFSDQEILRLFFGYPGPLTYLKIKLFCKDKKFCQSLDYLFKDGHLKNYYVTSLRNIFANIICYHYFKRLIRKDKPRPKKKSYNSVLSRAWVDSFYKNML